MEDITELGDYNGMTDKHSVSPAAAAAPPEWLRVKAATAFSGLSRAKLYDLIHSGRIRSASIREQGQRKGTRLISFASLRTFIESLATGGDGKPSL